MLNSNANLPFCRCRMRDMYKYLDTKYIKPCLLRDNQYRDPKIIETFENLTNKDAVEFMKRNPTQFAGLKTGGGGHGHGENGGGFVPPGMASVMGSGKSTFDFQICESRQWEHSKSKLTQPSPLTNWQAERLVG